MTDQVNRSEHMMKVAISARLILSSGAPMEVCGAMIADLFLGVSQRIGEDLGSFTEEIMCVSEMLSDAGYFDRKEFFELLSTCAEASRTRDVAAIDAAQNDYIQFIKTTTNERIAAHRSKLH
jgi:hypothetical protein